MSPYRQAFVKSLLVFSVLGIAACTDSEREPEESLEPNTFTVQRPYILDGSLFSFNLPSEIEESNLIESSSTELISSDINKLIFLDIDQSGSDTRDSVRFLNHTPTSEHVAYVDNNAVRLFDLDTQYDHELVKYNSPSDEGVSLDDIELVCDISQVITVDEENLKEAEVLYKDEFNIHVKYTSELSCETATTFEYDRIEIIDTEDVYTIRIDRETGTEDCPGEAELYPDDPDAREQCPIIETIKEDHIIYDGKRRNIHQNLFKAGTPIVDTENEQFGYLTLGAQDNTLRFFEVNPDTLRKREIWSYESIEFGMQTTYVPENDELAYIKGNTESFILAKTSDWVLIAHGWDIVKLNIEDLFDDDRDAERLVSFQNPVLERTPDIGGYVPPNFNYNASEDTLILADGFDIYYLAEGEEEARFVRTLNNRELVNFALVPFTNFTAIVKNYSDDQMSITSVNLPNGDRESTLIAKTTDPLKVVSFDDGIVVNTQLSASNEVASQFYNNLLTLVDTETLSNGSLDKGQELRPFIGPMSITLKIEGESDPDTVEDTSDISVPSPVLSVKSDSDEVPLGIIPSNVWNIVNLTVFSDDYGYVATQASSRSDAPTNVFYFNPSETTDEDGQVIEMLPMFSY